MNTLILAKAGRPRMKLYALGQSMIKNGMVTTTL